MSEQKHSPQWCDPAEPHQLRDGCTRSMHNAEIASYAALKAQRDELLALLEECVLPGVFGPWREVEDPALARHPADIETMCERYGYGAMLHYVAYLWQKNHPGAAHTVAACHDVRERIIAKAHALLARIRAIPAGEVKP